MDSNTLVRCRFHHEESCQLYCKECGDFVCFHCLGQFHQKHNFCQIRDAETNIRDEFKSLVLRKEHEVILNGSSIDRLLGLRDEIEHSIAYHTENRKNRIDMLKKDLLTQLNDTVSSKKTAIQETLDRIENVRLAFLKIDTTNLQELEFWSVVNILTEIKSCLLSANSHKHFLEKFTFRPNDEEMSVGQLISSHGQDDEAKSDAIEKSEHQNPPLCRDVSIQTENQRYSDSKIIVPKPIV
ncbi:unnamed protein product [Mytilus edulis]|uniref:B box-type domain-containing protein n=1 Tax=Mytilus edulis TaxID=6550 RepID=A0A8S3URW1_MYTED|nr:unnamed protein product [Mytilus edulis]